MKTKFTILIVGLLLFAEPSRCFAEYGGVVMSKALAKEMGVLIETEKNGDAGIRVRMEFKATGKLKQFAYVELRVGEGEDWTMSAPLRVSSPSSGSVSVAFSAAPAYLAKSMLLIFVDDARLGGTVYQLKVKDFIEPERAK